MQRLGLKLSFVVLAAASAFSGCGGDEPVDAAAKACNPLASRQCLMPWPSSAYLEPAETVTGFQVSIPVEAMPTNIDSRTVQPDAFNRWDGFSPSGPLLVAFDTGVSAEGLPPHTDPGQSLGPNSPIMLIEADTGRRIVFFAEVDMNAEDVTERTLIIRPLERLIGGKRYIVGVRKAVRAGDGGELPISEAFAALRDGVAYDHPIIKKIAPSYPSIFAALEAEGVSKDDLVLAWDFVTASDAFLTSDLLSMREQAMPLIGDAGAKLTFELTEVPSTSQYVKKLYKGTYTAPNFLTDGERDTSVLRRGADGLPEVDGDYQANISVLIPACLDSATGPRPVVVFGHGLFGNGFDYFESGFLQEVADQHCYVFVAGDFIGLTNRQLATVAFATNDMNRAGGISDKLAQSVINFIALENLARGPLAADPEFQINGFPMLDVTNVNYFGASLGGIMGNTFMAYDQHITKGIFGVPGGNWSLLIERSFAWSPLQISVIAAYEDMPTYQILVSMLSMRLEPYDPITTARHVINDPLPNTPAKQVFLYSAVGDSLVASMSTEMIARELGIGVCGPSLMVPYGMNEHTLPATSALTIYDERPGDLPSGFNVPPLRENGTHSDVNERPAVMRQLKQFFEEGQVSNQCMIGELSTVCDCSTGACD